MSTKAGPKGFGLGADGRLAISAKDFLVAHKPEPRQRPGLGDLVSKIATPIARALNLDCIDPATNDLKPESGCAKRRDEMNTWCASADEVVADPKVFHNRLYNNGQLEIHLRG